MTIAVDYSFSCRLTSNPHCFEPLILCLAPSLIHRYLGAQNIQQLLQKAANQSAPRTDKKPAGINQTDETNPISDVTKGGSVSDGNDLKTNSPKPRQLKLRIPAVAKECPAKDFKSYM